MPCEQTVESWSRAVPLVFGTVAIVGFNHGDLYGVDPAGWRPLIAAVLAIVLYPPVAAFARLKARRRDLAWLRYF